MAVQYSVWENTLTQVVYRVSNSGDAKVPLSAQQVIDADLYFSGQSSPVQANTSQLRAWLNSIPNA